MFCYALSYSYIQTGTTRSHFEYLCQYAKLLLARSPPPVANTQQELDQIELPLIYTFFMKNNLHVEASEILRSLAIDSGFVSTQHQDHKYPISQRIDYLSRSREHLRLASTSNEARGDVVKMLESVSDDLDVAILQQDVLRRLSITWATSPNAKQMKHLRRLRYDFLDISTIYNDYARRFELWECCLEILHICNHRNGDELRSVWKHLLQIGLLKGNVATLIKDLGTRFYVTKRSFVFPVEYLCSKLERWVVSRFSEKSVGFSKKSNWVRVLFLFSLVFVCSSYTHHRLYCAGDLDDAPSSRSLGDATRCLSESSKEHIR